MSVTVKSFRDLEVWQKSHRLTQEVFDLTERFPKSYRFDLTTQLRRAALSIPANIAEGCVSSHSKELVQSLNVAKRSVSETQYLLFFAHERVLVTERQFEDLDSRYEEVNRMLGGLRRSLQARQSSWSATRHSPLATRHS